VAGLRIYSDPGDPERRPDVEPTHELAHEIWSENVDASSKLTDERATLR